MVISKCEVWLPLSLKCILTWHQTSTRLLPLAARYRQPVNHYTNVRKQMPPTSFYCEVLVWIDQNKPEKEQIKKTQNKKRQIYYSLGLTCNNGNAHNNQEQPHPQILRTPTPPSIKHRTFNCLLVGLPSHPSLLPICKAVVTPAAHHLHITTGCQPVYGIKLGIPKVPLN